LTACERCGDRDRQLHFYAAGSGGPGERDRLFRTGTPMNPGAAG
jgi:hypothetical protein